jgi:uncharacterized repeat protein (TIGR02543 family)
LYTHPTSGAHSSPKIENILYINFSFNVKFNSNGGSSVQSQTIAYNNKAVKPTMPKRAGYTFVHWYKDSSLKSVYNFNTPVTDDIVLYAKWKANVKKITAPITRFSIKKGKVIKFKYALIYSDNKLTQKSKKIKFNKLGKRNVIIKSANKKLKLIINVTKKTIKPIKPVVKVAKQNNLYFIKIKSKNVAYYKFPKFNKITGSSYYKYGIYTKKSTKNKTVKVKWWNKHLKKKIK